MRFPICLPGFANRTTLQPVQESFPEWPSLFFDFVLPSRPEYFFLNLRIANPHMGNSKNFGMARGAKKRRLIV